MAPPKKAEIDRLFFDLKDLIGTLEDNRDALKEFEGMGADEVDNIEIIIDDQKENITRYRDAYRELSINKENLDSVISSREFTKQSNAIISSARRLLRPFKLRDHSTVKETTVSATKLTPLPLPSFKGDISEFYNFSTNFRSAVDAAGISDAQKLGYLRTALSGEVKASIAGLSGTASDYITAWQILNDRYNKPIQIINAHIAGIVQAAAMQRNSNKSFINLVDELNKHYTCLKNMSITGEKLASAFFHFLIDSKLDNETREKVKMQKPGEIPSIEETIQLLQNRVQIFTTIRVDPVHVENRNNSPRFSSNRKIALVATNSVHCPLCKEAHPLWKCSQFGALNVEQRNVKVNGFKLCKVCLAHKFGTKCSYTRTCYYCKGKHNTLLHRSKDETVNETTRSATLDVKASTFVPTDQTSSVLVCNGASTGSICLLSTAEVNVLDRNNDHLKAKCLLDSGSMINLITESFLNKLDLPTRSTNISLSGVTGSTSRVNKLVKLNISSRVQPYKFNAMCLVVDMITSKIPAFDFDPFSLGISADLPLADTTFHRSSHIDLLLGANHFIPALEGGGKPLGPNLPFLCKSKLGYVIAGELPFPQSSIQAKPVVSAFCSVELGFDLQRFWEMENVTPTRKQSLLSKDEQYCEELFEKTTTRASDGKFVVRIPFKSNIKDLGPSFHSTEKRFLSLERQLLKNPVLKAQYSSVINEYIDSGHATEVDEIEVDKMHFLPHHAVFKMSSSTTKVRVVFDGSAKTESGLSLNDCQFTGPTLQRDLFSILLSFRQHLIAVTADCAKMYRQVWVDDTHRNRQCILWRTDPKERIKVLKLNTVTFGLTSSSYLATKCLQSLACQNRFSFPHASDVIFYDFYMDDLISGADSVEQARELGSSVRAILAQAGFPLRKFTSNDPTVFQDYPGDTVDLQFKDATSKALGISWSPKSDYLEYNVTFDVCSLPLTKRNVLSNLSKVFDPLGLVSPLLITGKILMQEIWKRKLEWDEVLSDSLQRSWLEFTRSLSQTPKLRIPRYVFAPKNVRIELHGFSDASIRAYGACIYLRVVYSDMTMKTNLLCSKSRVCPIKPVTLPRLELSAAVLLCELYQKVLSIFPNRFEQLFFWTDSTIVLGWINSTPHQYKVFVANRIGFIQETTEPQRWFHCRSEENPADLISRGCSFESLTKNGFWLEGPEFLKGGEFSTHTNTSERRVEFPELKIVQSVNLVIEANYLYNILERYSSFTKLSRVFAYLLRFVHNSKVNLEKRFVGPLSATELQDAVHKIVFILQRNCFSKEFKDIESHSYGKLRGLKYLSLFIDSDGLIRVGGRIRNSDLNYDKIHPLLLPRSNVVTQLIVEQYHKRNLHCGSGQLLALVRESFWPISGRNLCRKVVHSCLRCFRFRPEASTVKMGDLPKCRLSSYKPCFYHTGVDFAGPLFMKDRYGRKPQVIKVYIALFICMTTRAIHLELVTSLSANAFVETFRRFIARRGKPKVMHSDNATNFTCAASEIRSLYDSFKVTSLQNSLTDYLSSEGISWDFIPPGSPHFGGLWESNVKATKLHLSKVLRDSRLTYEQLYTVLTQIESLLNSRPLCPLSDDPNDFSFLTPAHFLLGRPATNIPLLNLDTVATNRLDEFQYRQRLIRHFWQRWSREVLPEMQRRVKWTEDQGHQLAVGSLVLLADNQKQPYQWPLARVVKVHPGQDDKVRVASVRTANGSTFKRPVVKLCVLP